MSRSLNEWLDAILALHHQEIDLGLTRVQQVADRLGLNDNIPPVITVAGTNGKGSTVALLDALATHADYRTGVYTSPHITHFNERIRIAGQLASDDAICDAFQQIDEARGSTPLTYFEFSTLAALVLFKQAQLDVWILEVGLGGRLDAVNIIDADVALVTSIGLDHTDWLGNDIDQIAFEKAGIGRPNKPLLYGMPEVPDLVQSWATANHIDLRVMQQDFAVKEGQLFWQASAPSELLLQQRIPLGEDNLVMAVQALAMLNMLPPLIEIEKIAAATKLAGRSQYIYYAQRHWYLDVGHNYAAIARFFQRLPKQTGNVFGVCAMLLDKSADVLAAHADNVQHWYLASLDVPRGGTAERLSDALPSQAPRECFNSVEEALVKVLHSSQPEDTILVFGSFFTVAQTEHFFKKD